MYNLIVAKGFTNFDIKNGPHGDLADDVVWDKLLYDITANEYAAALACPDCSTSSKLHNLLGPLPQRGNGHGPVMASRG